MLVPVEAVAPAARVVGVEAAPAPFVLTHTRQCGRVWSRQGIVYCGLLDVVGEESRTLAQDDAVQKVALLSATTGRGNDDFDITGLVEDGKLVQWH